MPPITFVCCIEQGRLEAQTLLMLSTLRAHGGNLHDAPVLVVQGRRGLSLESATVQRLRQLDAQLIVDASHNPVPWFNYANKIAAVTIAQARARTPLVGWLDSDVLVAQAPLDLLLGDDEDFAARAEFLPPAVRPGDTTHEPYWRRLCGLFGLSFDDVPWLHVEPRGDDIRMYFNSGVFVWRRSSAFAATYASYFIKLLQSRLAQRDGNFFTADQVVLTPVVLQAGLRWRHLPFRCHHMTFQFQIDGPIASPPMQDSALIHYSKAMDDSHREKFLRRLQAELPSLHAFVTDHEAGHEPRRASHGRALQALAWRAARNLRWRLYARRVERV